VYDGVPPLPLNVILPVELPLHNTFVTLLLTTLNVNDGSLMVNVVLLVQPFLSLMPNVYVPAFKLLNVVLEPYVPPPML
jgi:hypothetical protein